jgi:hypothetical protein
MVLADNNPTMHANKNLFFICDIFLVKCGQALIKKMCLSHRSLGAWPIYSGEYSKQVLFAYQDCFSHISGRYVLYPKANGDNSLIINKQ